MVQMENQVTLERENMRLERGYDESNDSQKSLNYSNSWLFIMNGSDH